MLLVLLIGVDNCLTFLASLSLCLAFKTVLERFDDEVFAGGWRQFCHLMLGWIATVELFVVAFVEDLLSSGHRVLH